MPGVKEIRVKIASIKSTQKITKAMEMVAASKMRKAQERMRATRPYADKIRTVIGHLRIANPDYHHPYMVEREVKAVGFIVISTDRGLCGGLNVNVFKHCSARCASGRSRASRCDLCLIGSKAVQFFRRLSVQTLASVTHLGDKPARRGPDRHRQGDARPVQGRQARSAVPGQQRIRQHDDARSRPCCSCCRPRPRTRTSCRSSGTTSTSPPPTSCSTAC